MVGKPTIRRKISKQMKRYGNLYAKVYDLENLHLAEKKARKGKANRDEVKAFEANLEDNLLALQAELRDKRYVTSPYHTFTIYEPKERIISRLPFKDRIVHHAIMNVLEPLWVGIFSSSSYSCIKKRGIHGAAKAVKKALALDPEGTSFCLKGDVTKYYPSIDHDCLKWVVRRKIKDPDLLWLIDGIIDSAPGLPIGNYLSQYLANLYLTYFDHDLKTCFGLASNPAAQRAYFPRYLEFRTRGREISDEERARYWEDWIQAIRSLKHYFRYADDFVVLHTDKAFLQVLAEFIALYMGTELKLSVKGNWQVFPVEARGIDFVGYVFRHKYTLVRKSIKTTFWRKVSRAIKSNKDLTKKRLIHTVCSYYGWCLHCNAKHLLKTIFNKFDDEIKLRIPQSVSVC